MTVIVAFFLATVAFRCERKSKKFLARQISSFNWVSTLLLDAMFWFRIAPYGDHFKNPVQYSRPFRATSIPRSFISSPHPKGVKKWKALGTRLPSEANNVTVFARFSAPVRVGFYVTTNKEKYSCKLKEQMRWRKYIKPRHVLKDWISNTYVRTNSRIHKFLPDCIAFNQNRVRARGLLQCFLVALIFHEKGDCIVLLVPFASCASFTFVSFVSLHESFVNLDRLEVAPFTSFLQILRTPELWIFYLSVLCDYNTPPWLNFRII